MNDSASVRIRPASLPTNPAEWDAARKIKSERTLNDHVEAIHMALISDDKLSADYNRLLDAVYDEDAVEGSLATDNTLAAKMIRDYATSTGQHYVEGKKLATIVKALGIVLRRYGWSRSQRARMVGGEIVPNGE